MKIGDRVRDIGTQFVGTIVLFDPPTGKAERALIRADAASPTGKVGDPPPDQLWQKLDEIELIDRSGNKVEGKPGTSINTAGRRVDAEGNTVDSPMGGNFDAQGNRIKAPAGAAP